MDGLLVVDKPAGPTSHDVVARLRRVLREKRIGHTGTLDPSATGVLPLVIGRATRLARFLSGSDKSYEAVVRLGFATDTCDGEGALVGARYEGSLPSSEVIEQALDAFRGQLRQEPPVFSAKKVAGRRSYAMARCQAGARQVPGTCLAPVTVTVTRLVITALDADRLALTVDCSAGFYVRALARDLGARLGTGGHLVALRRTRAGALTLADAVALDAAERDPAAAAARVIPLAEMLPELPAYTLSADEVRRTVQGRDLASGAPEFGIRGPGFVRLVDGTGDLVAIAEPSATAPGLLHPSVVLR